MPTRIISLFGTYDFLAKTLPGVVLVLGTLPLLKHDTVPVPSVADRFLLLVVVLIVIGLIGTIVGELVHTISIRLEDTFAWFGRRALNTRDRLNLNLPEPEIASPNRRRDTDDGEFEKPGTLKLWYNDIYSWLIGVYSDLVVIAWDHRSMFRSRLDKVPRSGLVTHQHLHDFVREQLMPEGVTARPDGDEVYTIIVSYLSHHGGDRAFKFQSRYAFCRSMGLVLFIIALSYTISTEYPVGLWRPAALEYRTYLMNYYGPDTGSVVGMISAILFILSMIFVFATGQYKKRYVEYLTTELYLINTLLNQD